MINQHYLLSTLAKIAEEQGKTKPTLSDLESILSTFDETALTQSWRERIQISLWDGESDINNATAEYILNAHPYADLVYTLDIDNKTVYMQAHTPFENGLNPITAANFDEVSNNHADQIAKQNAEFDIFNAILLHFNLA
jgi:hypothetical protein